MNYGLFDQGNKKIDEASHVWCLFWFYQPNLFNGSGISSHFVGYSNTSPKTFVGYSDTCPKVLPLLVKLAQITWTVHDDSVLDNLSKNWAGKPNSRPHLISGREVLPH